MIDHECTVLLLASPQLKCATILGETLGESAYEYLHFEPNAKLSTQKLSFLNTPIYAIVELNRIDEYTPLLNALKGRFKDAHIIGVGSMFKMPMLLKASAIGIKAFVDASRSNKVVVKNILKALPKAQVETASETSSNNSDNNIDPTQKAKFLAHESTAIQKFLTTINNHKYVRQWILVAEPGDEIQLAVKEIVNVCGHPASKLFYPGLQGEDPPKGSIPCYLPSDHFNLSTVPRKFTIRCMHQEDFKQEKNVHEGWMVAHLPSLLRRPTDKVHYFTKWITKIEQMNLAKEPVNSLNFHEVNDLLCHRTNHSFQAQWYWMEQLVLRQRSNNKQKDESAVIDEKTLAVEQKIRQNYIKMVRQSIPNKDLPLLLQELGFVEVGVR